MGAEVLEMWVVAVEHLCALTSAMYLAVNAALALILARSAATSLVSSRLYSTLWLRGHVVAVVAVVAVVCVPVVYAVVLGVGVGVGVSGLVWGISVVYVVLVVGVVADGSSSDQGTRKRRNGAQVRCSF